jgi:ABC-type transport system substrate-binding protein
MRNIILSAAMACLLAAATPSFADQRNNVLVVGMGSEPFTLDPATGVSGLDYPILYTMFDRLVSFDPATMLPKAGLATKWEFVGDNNLALELTLRDGVMFQDGTKMDADAVAFSLKHLKESNRIHDLDPVTAIDVVAANKVRLVLAKPYSVLPAVLADRSGMVVSPTAVQKEGSDFPRHPVGAGPFMLKQWNAGTTIELQRFPDYWDKDRIKLSGVTFRTILNPTSLVSALLAGQIDYAFSVDPKNWPVLSANPRLRVALEPSTAWYELQMHTGFAPTDNQKVRQAIAMSVDRSVLADAILGPGMSGGSALMPVPPSWFAYSKSLENSVKYDPARAKQLLAEAGFPNGLTIKVCATSSLTGFGSDITDIESEEMKPAGIKLDVTVMTGSACLQAFNGTNRFNGWQGAFSGRPDPYLTYQQYIGSTGQYNRGSVNYPGVDVLLDKILAATTREQQKPYYDELNRLWIEDVPVVLLFYPRQYSVYGKNVAGEQPNLQGKPDVTSLYFKP